MAYFDENHVITCDAIILWDGITRPDTGFDGQPSYSLNVAIPDLSAEKGELETIATACLNSSEFKGQLPMGGNWPVQPVDLTKFAEDSARLNGTMKINAKSKFIPQVFDANGQVLQPMQYSSMLYPGAVVRLLVHAYAFNNKSKGIAFALDGVQIIDGTAPKLNVGGGISTQQMQSAFGAVGGAAPVSQPQPTPGATPQPAPQGGVTPQPGFVNGPTPNPAPVTEKSYTHPDGNVYTESQLRGWGWTDAQLAALQAV